MSTLSDLIRRCREPGESLAAVVARLQGTPEWVAAIAQLTAAPAPARYRRSPALRRRIHSALAIMNRHMAEIANSAPNSENSGTQMPQDERSRTAPTCGTAELRAAKAQKRK